MSKYNKPTLEITKYTIAKVNICSVSDTVLTENADWTINGVKNGLK